MPNTPIAVATPTNRHLTRSNHDTQSLQALRDFDTLQVGLERLLPRRALGAARSVRTDVRVRLQQPLIGAATEHVGHQNVRYGKLVGGDELAACEPAIELLQAHV